MIFTGDDMDITIRKANSVDAPRLSEIAVQAKSHWGYPQQWFDLWGDMFEITPVYINTNFVRVAVVQDILCGFVALSLEKNLAELEHMWVLPGYMGQGIGGMLMQHAMNYCQKNNIESIRIESDPNARGFYEKFGARHIGYVASVPAPRALPVLQLKLS